MTARYRYRQNPGGADWWGLDARTSPPLSVSEWVTEGAARAEADRLNAENPAEPASYFA